MKKFGNAYLIDRLRDRAEILQDGRTGQLVGYPTSDELWPRGQPDQGQKVNSQILTGNISKTVTDMRFEPWEHLYV